MNQQDKSFLTVFTAIMGVLVLISVAIFLIARLVSTVITYQGDDGSRLAAAVENRIAPVGRVVVAGEEGAEEAAPAAADMTGEQIVAQVCAACHQAGVLQAPKIGSEQDWEPRLSNGLDALVTNAINGLNAMPPRGGNPALSDEAIHEATVYMLEQSGIEAQGGGDADSGQSGAADDATSAESGANEDDSGRGIAGEPDSKLDAPTEGEAADTSSGGEGVDVAKGETLYKQACFACHDTGAANAPKLGDKAAWEPRIAQGEKVLLERSINGFNAMPPKGGAPQLSDEDMKDIVGYMVQAAQ